MIRIRRCVRYDRPVTTRLSTEQVKQLVVIADRERRPVSEVLRRAVEQMLDREARAAG